MFEYLVFREGYSFQGDREVRIEVDGKGLRYKEVGKPCRKISGSNDSPDCFPAFVSHVSSVASGM